MIRSLFTQQLHWPIQAYIRFWGIWLLVVGLDQWSKHMMMDAFQADPFQSWSIIDHFLYIQFAVNAGAAWGLFSGYSLYLGILGIAVMVGLYVGREKIGLQTILGQYAIALLAGGIVGNIYDRLAYGFVIDFIDVHLPGYRWPTFNIADTAICIGIGLFFLHTLKNQPPSASPK